MTSRSPTPRARSGFTLLELVVALLIVAAVIVGALALFDSTYRLSSTQLDRVDLQQSLRIAQREMSRMVRLAGRGGLPARVAVRVDHNVTGLNLLGDADSPAVADGTDVLTVRGVFQAPVYLVDEIGRASCRERV